MDLRGAALRLLAGEPDATKSAGEEARPLLEAKLSEPFAWSFNSTAIRGACLVEGRERACGMKVIAESGWFAARPSGTENVAKVYAESFRGPEHLKRIQEEAQVIIQRAFAAR